MSYTFTHSFSQEAKSLPQKLRVHYGHIQTLEATNFCKSAFQSMAVFGKYYSWLHKHIPYPRFRFMYAIAKIEKGSGPYASNLVISRVVEDGDQLDPGGICAVCLMEWLYFALNRN